MDPEIAALAGTAGTTVVTLMAGDAWQRTRDGVVALWRRVHPERADSIDAELEATRSDVAKYLFSYDAALAVTRDARHDDNLLDDNTPNPEVLPALVVGMSLDKPGCRPGYNGLKAIKRLRERGYPAGYLAGDAAYNNSAPDE
jgi:hypothetical protein